MFSANYKLAGALGFCSGIIRRRRPFCNTVAGCIELACKNEGVVIEREPGIFFDTASFPELFHGDRLERKIVVCHDPQWIEVSVCRQQVDQMQSILAAGFDPDDLESPVVSAGKDHTNPGYDLGISVDQFKVLALLQDLIVYGPEGVDRSLVG